MSSDLPPPSYTDSQRSSSGMLLEVHHGLRCSGCLQSPVVGTTYRCAECPDFKLCSQCCENHPPRFTHPLHHPILLQRFTGPNAILDTDIVHIAVNCDGCKQAPLRGKRYHCKTCPDYDLCQSCMASPPDNHPKAHRFICLATPVMWRYHLGRSCDVCGLAPIIGPRYHCTSNMCNEFDLCSDCMDLGIHHPVDHPMARVSGQPPA
ncbi:hypothetical protein L218DRAFT_756186 [Marasmius fiardii PR-910]|nr:hypothetical protein L218DRAFT_756186 [Marasmius fiardii PR-910]